MKAQELYAFHVFGADEEQRGRAAAASFPMLVAADFDFALERLWVARDEGVGPTGGPLESEVRFAYGVLRDLTLGYDAAVLNRVPNGAGEPFDRLARGPDPVRLPRKR